MRSDESIKGARILPVSCDLPSIGIDDAKRPRRKKGVIRGKLAFFLPNLQQPVSGFAIRNL
ncbi:MAG: hypothetical protein B7Y41_06880 [Hydrogenophilales bacterium 28-61-23]|nr:MAG: hypothetical protein B7Y41_06880 [Hydrogenophilales bacterium 28-61-23]